MENRKGFTLIELLVVIAIIAILAAILFPIFISAREKGRQAACMSNLRQIATGIQQYASDWGDTLPLAGNFSVTDWRQGQCFWSYYIQPYTKNSTVFLCTSYKITKATAAGYGLPYWGYGTSYGFNAHLGMYINATDPRNVSTKTGQIRQPSRTVMIADGYDGTLGAYQIVGHPHVFGWSYHFMHWRHFDRANVMFVDGHTRPMREWEVLPLDPTWPPKKPNDSLWDTL